MTSKNWNLMLDRICVNLHPDETYRKRIVQGWSIEDAARSQKLTNSVIEYFRTFDEGNL